MIITLTGATASKHLGGLNFYSIIVNKSSGVTVTLDKTTVDKDKASSTTVTGTLAVAEGYTLSTVKIMMGNTDKTSAWYNSSTGAITISGITANVVITANATANSGSGDSGSGDSGNTGDSGSTDTDAVFDYDFTTNTIDDYALDGVFTVPSGSNTSTIEYDSTYGMSLNSNLPNGLNLVNPIDASKPWELEFTATFVTPTVLAGNRRAFLAGVDLYPFVFINGNTFDAMGFQISNGTHATVGYGKLVYDKEVTYKITYDGDSNVAAYADGKEIGTGKVNFAGHQFTVMLGNVSGKSTAYVWQNVEADKKSYLKKFKFKYV